MGDSSSEESFDDTVNWTFYKDRPEWSDVKPTQQDDGFHPVVQIAYSDKFKDVFDYFRTVLRTDERSQRAFDLTTDAANLNPANYTVWYYRRLLLKDLNKDLKSELEYVGEMIKEHPKTYQLWHHRSAVVEWLKDAADELSFTEKVLNIDAKNYHAWQHRQWSLRNFGMWDNEMEYISQLLQDDVRNNSAWNHRYFVISNTTKYTDDVLKNEVVFTMECIRKAVHNESAWNYLSGILYCSDLCKYPGMEEFLFELYNSGVRSSYLLACMIDFYESQLELTSVNNSTALQQTLDLCSDLANEHDTIRCEYWKYVARCMAQKFGKAQEIS